MSNNALGDDTGQGGYAATTVLNVDSSTISAGDVVALNQDSSDNRYKHAARAASGDANRDQEFGIAKEDITNSSRGTVQTGGSVIGNVTSSVQQGERLGPHTGVGALTTSDGGNWVAMSGAGGTDSAGTSLGSTEAEVFLG